MLLPSEPLLAKCSIVPNIPAVNTPLDIPKRKTTEFNIPGSLYVSPRREIINSENAEKMHPVISQNFSDPRRSFLTIDKEANPILNFERHRIIKIIPINVPILWNPSSFVDSPTAKPKTSPAKGSNIGSCIEKAPIEIKIKIVKSLASLSIHTFLIPSKNGSL